MGKQPPTYNIGGGAVALADHIRKYSALKFPETKYCFVESCYDLRTGSIAYDYDGWSFIPAYSEEAWWDPLGFYHVEGLTLSFLDGHAEKYKFLDDRSIIYHHRRDDWGSRVPQPNNPDIKWFVEHYPIATTYQ